MNPLHKDIVDEAEIDTDVYRQFGGKQPVVTPGYAGSNIRAGTFKEVMDTLSLCNELDPKMTVLIFGNPGIGKSMGVAQFARNQARAESRQFIHFNKLSKNQRMEIINDPSKYYVLIDLRPATLEPERTTGVPDIEFGKKYGYLDNLVPGWVELVTKTSSEKDITNKRGDTETVYEYPFSGLIFLDEVNSGSSMVINSLLQLTNDRVIVDRFISDKAFIVAAANLEVAGSGISNRQPLDTAFLNRGDSVVLIPDANEWANWAKEIGTSQYIIDFVLSDKTGKYFIGTGKDVVENNLPVTPRGLVATSRKLRLIEQKYLQAAENIKNKKPALEGITGITGNMYQDVANAVAGSMGTAWSTEFIQWFMATIAWQWEDVIARAEKGEWKKKSSKLSTSQLMSLTEYMIKQILSRYERASQQPDETLKDKAIKQIGLETYKILSNLDLDTAVIIISELRDNIRDKPHPTLDVVARAKLYAGLMDTVLLKAHEQGNTEFLTKLKDYQTGNVARKSIKESFKPKKLNFKAYFGD